MSTMNLGLIHFYFFFLVEQGKLGVKLLLISQFDFKQLWWLPSLGSRHN